METWTEIRRRVLIGEISKRQACREYDIHWCNRSREKMPRAGRRLIRIGGVFRVVFG